MNKLQTQSIEQLVKLRSAIEQELVRRASSYRAQIALLEKASTALSSAPRLVASRPVAAAPARKQARGYKVKPKYRDPRTGQTWAGRGNKPTWLQARLKGGNKLEQYLIKKAA